MNSHAIPASTPPVRVYRSVGARKESVILTQTIEQFAYHAPAVAKALPIYDGDIARHKWIIMAGRWYITEPRCLAILTRDNMVRMGFWKNPDFENCLHLSLSFRTPGTFEPLGWDGKRAREIAGAIFGKHTRKCWWEPAYTPDGKALGVGHYRLFFDPLWKEPIVPKGEPYSIGNGGLAMTLWTDAQADLPTPHFNADITDELPLRRAKG